MAGLAVAVAAVAFGLGWALEDGWLPGRSTVTFGSLAAQLELLGWEIEGSSPITSFVSGSPTGMNGVSVSVPVEAAVTSRTGSMGPSGGNGEPTGQFLGNRLLSVLVFLQAAIYPLC